MKIMNYINEYQTRRRTMHHLVTIIAESTNARVSSQQQKQSKFVCSPDFSRTDTVDSYLLVQQIIFNAEENAACSARFELHHSAKKNISLIFIPRRSGKNQPLRSLFIQDTMTTVRTTERRVLLQDKFVIAVTTDVSYDRIRRRGESRGATAGASVGVHGRNLVSFARHFGGVFDRWMDGEGGFRFATAQQNSWRTVIMAADYQFFHRLITALVHMRLVNFTSTNRYRKVSRSLF